MKKTELLVLILCILACVKAEARTFHFLAMFDTDDPEIGSGMDAERKCIVNDIKTIGGILAEEGYETKISVKYGENCGKTQLMQMLNRLTVQPDDVVMFYYGGHGGRAVTEMTDSFPQMCLAERSTANYVPATLVKNLILKKNPRLTVVLTGCCNSADEMISVKSTEVISQSYTALSASNKEAYKRLFLHHTGVVQMTSSKAGEYSWVCKNTPSYFALYLLAGLKCIGEGTIKADWNELCTAVEGAISSQKIVNEGKVYFQHPYKRINTEYVGPDSNHRNPDIRFVDDSAGDLGADLAMLVDKSRSVDSRLQLVNSVMSRHFTGNSKIITIGRDMSTVVDYEDAETFLNRIAMSPYIEQINIIEHVGEKNSILRVHEVRSR